jgi:hypothetical protein
MTLIVGLWETNSEWVGYCLADCPGFSVSPTVCRRLQYLYKGISNLDLTDCSTASLPRTFSVVINGGVITAYRADRFVCGFKDVWVKIISSVNEKNLCVPESPDSCDWKLPDTP